MGDSSIVHNHLPDSDHSEQYEEIMGADGPGHLNSSKFKGSYNTENYTLFAKST